MSNAATVTVVRDEAGERLVVQQADEVIWIADELMDQAQNDGPQLPGGLEVLGELIAFGTPGEGLGRMTYRLIGHDAVDGWHIAKREALAENTP